MKRPRLLMADDHTLVLEGFRRILEPHFDLVGTADNGRTLVSMAISLVPDAVLLDISMPVLNGFEAARLIRESVPTAKLIFVTMHGDPAYVEEALRLGASAYVIKRSAASELTEAIRQALSGRIYVTPLVAENANVPLSAADSEKVASNLSSRERQVLKHIAEGRSGKEIAYLLTISVRTVEFHKRGVMRKLNLRTTADLTRYAVRQGLVEA